MRIHEITESRPEPTIQDLVATGGQEAKEFLDLRKIIKAVQQGDWKTAILTGALNSVPALKPYVTPRQYELLNLAANTWDAVDFGRGLARWAASRGVTMTAGAGPVAALVALLTHVGEAGASDEFAQYNKDLAAAKNPATKPNSSDIPISPTAVM